MISGVTVPTVKSIIDQHHHLKEGSVLKLDLDQTVFDSATQLGSDPWHAMLYRSIETLQNEKYTFFTQNIFDLLTYYTTLNIQMMPIEEKLPDYINRLQNEEEIPVFGLTARGKKIWYKTEIKGIDELTYQQLKSIGIHFAQPDNLFGGFEGDDKEVFSPYKGIFFTANNPAGKGTFAVNVYEKAKSFPKHVSFFDDRRGTALDVFNKLTQRGIACSSFHYNPYADLPYGIRPFNLLTSVVQLQHLIDYSGSRILTDAQAESESKKDDFQRLAPIQLFEDLLKRIDNQIHLLNLPKELIKSTIK